MPEKYAMSPDSPEYQQAMQQKKETPNQLAEAEQVKGQYNLQAAQMKAQFDGQVKQMQAEHKNQLDMMNLQFKMHEADKDRASREAIEAAKLEVQAYLASLPVDIGQPGMGAGMENGQ
jgi:hypothetical protein